MMNFSVISGCTDKTLVKIDERELALRLKTEVGYTNEEIEKCKTLLSEVVNCKYAFVKVPIDLSVESYVNLGFATVKSADLYKNLKGCKEAIVFAVTLGLEVDRLLNRLDLLSTSRHFITDAISSAMAESYCDYVNQMLSRDFKTKPRFSAGYGDLSLEIQSDVLRVLSADKTLGITLNQSLLMTPVKSITAIMGVLDN